MPKRRQRKNPIQAAAREAQAQRRIGDNSSCLCGEKRPEALLAGRRLAICYECAATSGGRSAAEAHHVAGKSNDAETIIDIPTNDHRAELNVDQYDWPRRTRENPDRSPLLAMSGCIRGFMAMTAYLTDKLLGWIPEQLEMLDALLCEQWGSQWWLRTNLRRLPPK